jgi:hypothetical protein
VGPRREKADRRKVLPKNAVDPKKNYPKFLLRPQPTSPVTLPQKKSEKKTIFFLVVSIGIYIFVALILSSKQHFQNGSITGHNFYP